MIRLTTQTTPGRRKKGPGENGQDSEAISWHVRERRRPDEQRRTQTTTDNDRRHADDTDAKRRTQYRATSSYESEDRNCKGRGHNSINCANETAKSNRTTTPNKYIVNPTHPLLLHDA